MFRYYMTPETRQAVIAESNRLIAERAALNAARKQVDAGHVAEELFDGEPFTAQDPDQPDFGADSTFARLVADLQLTALKTTSLLRRRSGARNGERRHRGAAPVRLLAAGTLVAGR